MASAALFCARHALGLTPLWPPGLSDAAGDAARSPDADPEVALSARRLHGAYSARVGEAATPPRAKRQRMELEPTSFLYETPPPILPPPSSLSSSKAIAAADLSLSSTSSSLTPNVLLNTSDEGYITLS